MAWRGKDKKQSYFPMNVAHKDRMADWEFPFQHCCIISNATAAWKHIYAEKDVICKANAWQGHTKQDPDCCAQLVFLCVCFCAQMERDVFYLSYSKGHRGWTEDIWLPASLPFDHSPLIGGACRRSANPDALCVCMCLFCLIFCWFFNCLSMILALLFSFFLSWC